MSSFVTRARAGTAEKKKLFDGGGLFLMLTPAGTAVWRIKYRVNGKETLATAGLYPEVGLPEARAQRDAFRSELRGNRDPRVEKKNRAASAVTFGALTEEWLDKRKPDWSKIHFTKTKQALERDVLKTLGKRRLEDITSVAIAPVIEAISRRGSVETAGKVLQNVNAIFQFALAKGLCATNPAAPVRELLPRKREHSQRPALLTFKDLGDLLRRAEVAPISPPVRIAHRLIAFTASRIGNAITSKWSEFDLDGDLPTWITPRAHMKAKGRRFDHKVILAPTIASELRTWRNATGGKGYLFESPTGRAHITHEALEKALRVTLRMGGKHSVHGWRASFSTLARDHGFSRDCVELALDHIADNETARAYDRGDRLAERVQLMYWWDSQLTAAQQGAAAIPHRPAKEA